MFRRRKRVSEEAGDASFGFDALGWLQFERFGLEVLSLFCGLDRPASNTDDPFGRSFVFHEGVRIPGEERDLSGPTLVLIVWVSPAAGWGDRARRLEAVLEEALVEWARVRPRSLLVLTNIATKQGDVAGLETVRLGPPDLGALVQSSPELRLRMPTVLGIAPLDRLLAPSLVASSSFDLEAASLLARIFVPTNAYAAALEVLERHHFSALIGPPEMGKTAIARMIGLAALSNGREVYECNRPDELWKRFAPARAQLFIADDAFGSTEYRPDAAERWALELDRVLQAMDEQHWLVWTSRPAPLKAGLRRIHREHGIESFPQPSEVQVDAADLGVPEKALILFRHARATDLPDQAVTLVRSEGWSIVSHPHFTPERIRRFVGGRLLELTDDPGGPMAIQQQVVDEIRDPTEAMIASFRALSVEHQTLLLALLDTPPGPVPQRLVIDAFRRHTVGGLQRHPPDLIDRLTDHFLRVIDGSSIDWVHPSWRDLVIEALRADKGRRQRFLRACSLEGVLLAISTAGGQSGERALPLMRADADWDELTDRLAMLAPTLDGPGISRLFLTLDEARASTLESDRNEIDALATYTLQLLARRWNKERELIPIGVLAAWFELAASVGERPHAPDLGSTWISLLPTACVDLDSASDVTRFDDWTALCELLDEHESEQLKGFGFPKRHHDIIRAFVADTKQATAAPGSSAQRESWIRILRRLRRLAPEYAPDAADIITQLATVPEQRELPETYTRRPLSPELKRLLDTPLPKQRSDQEFVTRVLADL